jgi:hypothetical protein
MEEGMTVRDQIVALNPTFPTPAVEHFGMTRTMTRIGSRMTIYGIAILCLAIYWENGGQK